MSSGVGTAATAEVVNRNIVRGVQPAGQIWVIADLDARIKANGDISVKGKGLILGGGNNAGRATGQSVFATLICEAVAPFTERNTNLAGVPLTAGGDFRINDRLAPAPAGCDSPMLLIRNAAGLAWFAVGIPSRTTKRLRFYGTRAKERSAEPVPPRILSGGTTSRNSYSFALAISSRK